MLAGAKHTVLLFSNETITSEVFFYIFKSVLSYYISQTILAGTGNHMRPHMVFVSHILGPPSTNRQLADCSGKHIFNCKSIHSHTMKNRRKERKSVD